MRIEGVRDEDARTPGQPAGEAASWRHFTTGAQASLAVLLGYVAVGIALGVVARTAGLTIPEVALMSLIVYAGSAQFAAIGLLASGASVAAIVVTVLLVNLRHLLYSAALAPLIRHFPTWQTALAGTELTDETFAVASSHLAARRDTPASWLFGLNLTAHTTWVVATTLGAVVGRSLPNTRALGLDFALASMFAALLVLQVVRRPDVRLAVVVAALAALVAVAGAALMPASWAIIAAALVGASAGVLLEERRAWR